MKVHQRPALLEQLRGTSRKPTRIGASHQLARGRRQLCPLIHKQVEAILQPQREPMAQPHMKLWELAASDDDRVFSPYVWAVKLVLDAKVISLALLVVLTVKHPNRSTLPARLRRSLPRGLRAAGPGVREGALALLSEGLDPALPDGAIPDLSVS